MMDELNKALEAEQEMKVEQANDLMIEMAMDGAKEVQVEIERVLEKTVMTDAVLSVHRSVFTKWTALRAKLVLNVVATIFFLTWAIWGVGGYVALMITCVNVTMAVLNHVGVLRLRRKMRDVLLHVNMVYGMSMSMEELEVIRNLKLNERSGTV